MVLSKPSASYGCCHQGSKWWSLLPHYHLCGRPGDGGRVFRFPPCRSPVPSSTRHQISLETPSASPPLLCKKERHIFSQMQMRKSCCRIWYLLHKCQQKCQVLREELRNESGWEQVVCVTVAGVEKKLFVVVGQTSARWRQRDDRIFLSMGTGCFKHLCDYFLSCDDISQTLNEKYSWLPV